MGSLLGAALVLKFDICSYEIILALAEITILLESKKNEEKINKKKSFTVPRFLLRLPNLVFYLYICFSSYFSTFTFVQVCTTYVQSNDMENTQRKLFCLVLR